MGTKVIERSIIRELHQALDRIERDCIGKTVQANDMFTVPINNALWSLFMGKRYNHEDVEIHRLQHEVKA